jgi:HEAT repeat protein
VPLTTVRLRGARSEFQMKKAAERPVRLGVCLLLVMAALAAVVISISSKPKSYEGKTVRQWVSLLNERVDQKQQREEASRALAEIGAPALPELERILAWRPSIFDTVRGYAVRVGFAKPRRMSPFGLQIQACEAAYLLAERANVDISGLVPHLTYHFTNGASSNGGRALAAAGPTGIAVLTNFLFSGKRSLRDHAGWALANVRGRPEVIDALIRSATNDPDPTLRAFAVFHLEGSRSPAQQVVPLGLKFLQSDHGYERLAAASLLQEYRDIPEVRTALKAAISDPDERVRSLIQRVLEDDTAKETSR